MKTVSFILILSTSESHTALNPDPSVMTICQLSLCKQLFFNERNYDLQILHNSAELLVDIIFVHDLTDDSYNTWLKTESEIYWSVYLLSKDVLNTQIMMFKYNADITKFLDSVLQNNSHNYASALFEKLAAV